MPPRYIDILSARNSIVVSHVSFWEIAIKRSLGKLDIPDSYLDTVLATETSVLPISVEHIRMLETLPYHHRDPFDRMLIAQARTEGLTLLTADIAFLAYDVMIV